MQLCTQVMENYATAYPTVQLRIPTFRQEKAIKNDIMITAYHQWHHEVVTTLYLLLHPVQEKKEIYYVKVYVWGVLFFRERSMVDLNRLSSYLATYSLYAGCLSLFVLLSCQ